MWADACHSFFVDQSPRRGFRRRCFIRGENTVLTLFNRLEEIFKASGEMWCGGGQVVNAYSLISADPGKTAEVFRKVKELAGIKRVEAVAGPYDIVARIEVDSLEKLTKTIFGDIRSIPGVTNTTTLIVVEL
jgi:DNA-binding Lrp family transcriptional regulator